LHWKKNIKPTIQISGRTLHLVNGKYFAAHLDSDSKNDIGIFEIEEDFDENSISVCQMVPFQRVLPTLYIHTQKIQKVQIIEKNGQFFHKLNLISGESGSPIVYKKDEQYFVVGLHCGISSDKILRTACLFDKIKCTLINNQIE